MESHPLPDRSPSTTMPWRLDATRSTSCQVRRSAGSAWTTVRMPSRQDRIASARGSRSGWSSVNAVRKPRGSPDALEQRRSGRQAGAPDERLHVGRDAGGTGEALRKMPLRARGAPARWKSAGAASPVTRHRVE